jgi:hypothetical protein
MSRVLAFASSQPWRELYVAALFEDDEEQLVRLIGEARSAAVIRWRELLRCNAAECNEERKALDNALYFLNLLEIMSRQKTKAAAA